MEVLEEREGAAAAVGLSTVGEGELQQSVRVHLVEKFELSGQLMRLLPLGGEFGALLVIVVVWQLLARVRVPAKGPEAVQVDLVAHGGSQRVHQDACAEAFRRQLFGFPVAVEQKGRELLGTETDLSLIKSCKVVKQRGEQKVLNVDSAGQSAGFSGLCTLDFDIDLKFFHPAAPLWHVTEGKLSKLAPTRHL